MGMLKKLKDYYDVNGIAALNFRCKGNSDKFTTAKESFIGSKYEKGSKYPRILFISLDSGEGGDPKDNTFEAIRRWEEEEYDIENVRGRNKSKHWFRTHELTWMILGKFEPDIKISNVKSYFAHINSAKCCLNKGKREKADRRLFENCREYIPHEVILLDPDVIITQGDEAKYSIKDYLHPIESKELKGHLFQLSNRKKVLWFHTYHPSSYNNFNRQRREEFGNYANLVYQFYSA